MKRLHTIALLSTILFSTTTFASDFEFTPLAGYDIAEGNIKLDNYAIAGAELQYNGFKSAIKPEISFLYSLADYQEDFLNYKNRADTNVMRFLVNGVYEFNNIGAFVPSLKAGLGYETMDDAYDGNSDGSAVADLGLALKMPITKNIALKLETLYMSKYNDERFDSNLALLAGLTVAFGGDEQKAPALKAEPEVTPVQKIVSEPVVAPVIEPIAKPVVEEKVEIIAIPETYEGTIETFADGSPKKINLGVGFERDSYRVAQTYSNDIERFTKYLKQHPDYKVDIAGYADSIGTYEYNQKLSLKRANIVKDMLVANGIASDRLTTTGNGEYNPIATNMYKAGRAQNRRIEVTIIK
jgi:OOP family OmpA-OmpF porin